MLQKLVSTLMVCVCLVGFVSPVYAVESGTGTGSGVLNEAIKGSDTDYARFITKSGGQPPELIDVVANTIYLLLGFLGIIMVLLMLYGGFLWMTAGGDTDQVTTAQNYIKNAAFGAAVLLSAWAVAWFVVEQIVRVVGKK